MFCSFEKKELLLGKKHVGLIRSINMLTHAYFTSVFHLDKMSVRASIRMSWTENKECPWYFVQIRRAHKELRVMP